MLVYFNYAAFAVKGPDQIKSSKAVKVHFKTALSPCWCVGKEMTQTLKSDQRSDQITYDTFKRADKAEVERVSWYKQVHVAEKIQFRETVTSWTVLDSTICHMKHFLTIFPFF